MGQIITKATGAKRGNYGMNKAKKRKPVLIEQSAKKFKLIRAAGILILLSAVVIGVVTTDKYSVEEGWGTFLMFTGLVTGTVVFGVGTILTWWHHG